MAGCVDEGDLNAADRSGVAALDLDQVGVGQAGDAVQEFGLGLVNIDLGLDLLQQLGRALNMVAGKLAAQMVLVIVGDQRLADRVAGSPMR